MKFIFERDAMIKEISIAQEIITNKSPISILSNILLIVENNGITIKATDSTMKFSTTIPVEVIEEGSTTIYCDKFMSILSSLPSGEVEFSKEDIDVVIKPISKKVTFKLKSQTSDKFPEMGSSENVPFFEFSSKDFKEMIRETIFAVSGDPIRYWMTGIYFVKDVKNEDLFTSVASDSRRLSCVNKNGFNVPDFLPSIVPTKILSCVLKNAPDEGNINIAFVDKSIFIKFGNVEFSSALIDGNFPPYKSAIPSGFDNSFTVNKADLEEALKRTIIMVDRKVSRIVFKISPGELKIISPESDNGSADEIIPCKYDGQNISLAFNYNYVTEPLKVIDSENVVFDFNMNKDSQSDEEVIVTKAVVMHSDPAGDYIHIVMPMNY